ncbi:MAG: hypothetical protein KDK99_02910 [Verrucomicrobiales bacterium]|nr:hypothetical protein [Verrucomicrobiales bacterium]
MISDDPVDAVSISTGVSSAVVDAGSQVIYERIGLVNAGVEGRVSISVGSTQDEFTPVGQAVFTPADTLIAVNFAGIQGRYLRVEFEASRAGKVRNFQVFGSAVDTDYVLKQNGNGAGGASAVNVATGLGGARIIYAHPAPMGSVDEMVEYGSFAFPESDERYRTVIYDLGQPRFLKEFGSVHSPRPVRLEVYAFSDLPETEDWRGRRAFDPTAFENTEPVASYEDPQGLGYAKFKPKQTVKARYVAMRWEPDFNPPAFSVGGVFIGAGGIEGASYEPGAGGPGAGAAAGPVGPDGGGADGAGGGADGSGSGAAGSGGSGSSSFQADSRPWGGFTGPFAPNSVSSGGVGGLPAPGTPAASTPAGTAASGGGGTRIIVAPPPVVTPVSQ